jgi:dUTP pyrophosphatase
MVGATRLKVLLRTIEEIDQELEAIAQGVLSATRDASLDLSSIEDLTLAPGARAAVPTGWAVAIPAGMAGLVVPRSGNALRHGLTVANAPGLIDSGYRGELKVILVNLGADDVRIAIGDRIAQLVVTPVSLAAATEVDGSLPLHLLLQQPAPYRNDNVALALLQAFPAATKVQDKFCLLPLHYAIRHCSSAVIAAVVAVHPDAAGVRVCERWDGQHARVCVWHAGADAGVRVRGVNHRL